MDKATLISNIDQINSNAWEIRVNDSTRAHSLSKEAVKLADEAGYIKGKAEGLRTLGFTYIRLSKHAEAKKLLEEALQLFISVGDLNGQSDVLEYFGIIERSLGNYKSSFESLFKSLELRKQTDYAEGMSLAYYHLGVTYRYIGNLEQALEYFLQSLTIAKQIKNWIGESYSLNNIGSIYFELNDYAKALEYYNQSLLIRKNAGDKWGEGGCLDNIGHIYFRTRDYNKAKEFCENSLSICHTVGDKKGEANALFHLAEINDATGEFDKAIDYAKGAQELRKLIGDKKGQAEMNILLANILLKQEHKSDSKIRQDLLESALRLANEIQVPDLLYKIHFEFYKLFKQEHHYEEALAHLELSNALEKNIHSNTINQKILNLEITHQVENAKKESEIFRLRNIELVGLYEEIKKQKEQTEQALVELKATQAQLIQSEKMASLGELTAGIAHEIQNPLNFVNNFSEVNTELAEELKNELSTGNHKLAIEIADDIKRNAEKINHHGKRADAIVKGMLQHSLSSSGVKELTNINVLANEYLRLSYHGLRAKDKSFNVAIKTDFDESIGNINIIPQDIGRVLLNLYNNAFYAVYEKNKIVGPGHQPKISVQTKKTPNGVEIKVTDNGNGIPEKIANKIFQPFFTTKPPGEGTGLGLSLSYDIITKEHDGTIKAESKEGEGTMFTIQLPAITTKSQKRNL